MVMTEKKKDAWETVIGLEVHLQFFTQTKILSLIHI